MNLLQINFYENYKGWTSPGIIKETSDKVTICGIDVLTHQINRQDYEAYRIKLKGSFDDQKAWDIINKIAFYKNINGNITVTHDEDNRVANHIVDMINR